MGFQDFNEVADLQNVHKDVLDVLVEGIAVNSSAFIHEVAGKKVNKRETEGEGEGGGGSEIREKRLETKRVGRGQGTARGSVYIAKNFMH